MDDFLVGPQSDENIPVEYERSNTMSNVLLVYADGCCKGNPGPGGSACVMFAGDEAEMMAYIEERKGKKVDPGKVIALEAGKTYRVCPNVYTCCLWDSKKATTNNIAELSAVQLALDSVFLRGFAEQMKTKKLTIITDSKYTVGTFNDWVKAWALNRWRKSDGKSVANVDLIKPMWEQLKAYDYKLVHTYGHVGDYFNEICDALSNRAVSEL